MLEAIALAFAFGTFWFWLACLAVFVLVLMFSENDKNFLAGFSLLAFLVLMEWSGTFNIFSSPLLLIGGIVTYLLVGAGWSVGKWFSLLHKQRDQLSVVKESWVRQWNKDHKGQPGLVLKPNDRVPDGAAWDDFATFVENSDYSPNRHYGWKPEDRQDLVPEWSRYKGKLTSWVMFWPTSAFWTLLNDPLVRAGKYIVQRLKNVYRRVADHVFRDFRV